MNVSNATAGDISPVISGHVLYISGVLMVFMILVSLICNCVLLGIMRTNKELRSPIDCLVIFLCSVEVLIRIFGSPLIASSIFASKWLFGYYGCQFYGFTMTCLCLTTISLHAAISIERYMLAFHKKRLAKRTTTLIAAGCFVHGLFWAVMPILGWSEYVLEPCKFACAPDWSGDNLSYTVSLCTVGFFLPLGAMAFCYIRIFTKVRMYNSRETTSSVRPFVETDISKVMITIMFSFLFCWLPYAVTALLRTFDVGEIESLPVELTLLPLFCAKSSGMWSPVIYCITNRQVRQSLNTILEKIRMCTRKRKTAPLSTPPDNASMVVHLSKGRPNSIFKKVSEKVRSCPEESETRVNKMTPRGPLIRQNTKWKMFWTTSSNMNMFASYSIAYSKQTTFIQSNQC